MRLGKLIKRLEQADPTLVVPVGFGGAHSYRGDYADLAFEPMPDVTVGQMLAEARAAVGQTFTGYKGGEYTMDEDTRVWLAIYGESGEGLGDVLLDYMLGVVRANAP